MDNFFLRFCKLNKSLNTLESTRCGYEIVLEFEYFKNEFYISMLVFRVSDINYAETLLYVLSFLQQRKLGERIIDFRIVETCSLVEIG